MQVNHYNKIEEAEIHPLSISDEPEPSWLEPQLELKDFQLGSARLVTFFTSARMQNRPKMSQKSAENEPKFDSQLKTYFLIIFLII